MRPLLAALGLCMACTAYSMDRKQQLQTQEEYKQQSKQALVDITLARHQMMDKIPHQQRNERRGQFVQKLMQAMATRDAGRQADALIEFADNACVQEFQLLRAGLRPEKEGGDTRPQFVEEARKTLALYESKVHEYINQYAKSTTTSRFALKDLFHTLCIEFPTVLANVGPNNAANARRELEKISQSLGPQAPRSASLTRGTLQWLTDRAIRLAKTHISEGVGGALETARPDKTLSAAVAAVYKNLASRVKALSSQLQDQETEGNDSLTRAHGALQQQSRKLAATGAAGAARSADSGGAAAAAGAGAASSADSGADSDSDSD